MKKYSYVDIQRSAGTLYQGQATLCLKKKNRTEAQRGLMIQTVSTFHTTIAQLLYNEHR